MPQPNGHKPQHHLSVKEIVEQQRAKSTQRWHSDWLDMDFLIRPRSGAEIAQLSEESTRLQADIEQYAGTPDAPAAIEQLRIGLRAVIPVLLDPETKLPRFGVDEVDDLLELPMPIINELVEAANRVSAFTKEEADEAAKNSAAMVGNSTSSVSPEEAATSTPSPSPASSTHS